MAWLLAACGPADEVQPTGIVDPADYNAFYLWPGVEPVPQMQDAVAVYVLWGEVRIDDPARVVPLRHNVPAGRSGELWLVIRAERLDWGEGAYAQLLAEAERWNAADRLTGVQVDFDSSTGGLRGYAEFLASLRRRLPESLKLSATGLMDWPANASSQDLAAMRSALDEIVVQTYQHTTTLTDAQQYMQGTRRLRMPYRVALVEGGKWAAQQQLTSDPNFAGYVVFLLAEKFRSERHEPRK